MKVIELLTILLISAIAFCTNADLAYADNNSAASGTPISTPQGNVAIEKSSPGDRIIGYDFEKHQNKINKISSIEKTNSLGYYSINNETKIIGTQFVYIKTNNNPTIIRVGQLKKSDILIATNHQNYVIKDIKQIVEPSSLYQIILENDKDNFFTNRFLVYGGETASPAFSKNNTYVDCFGAENYGCFKANPTTIPGIFLTLLAFVLGILLTDKIFKWISHNQ